jgi:hypothetical protein
MRIPDKNSRRSQLKMKTNWFTFFVAIAAVSATTAIVRAQDNPFSFADAGESDLQSDATGDDYAHAAIETYARAANQPYADAVSDGAVAITLYDVDRSTRYYAPRLEASATFLYLQPGSGSLEYGTLVSPLPPATPHWQNQSIRPSLSPAFNFGFRYFVPETGNDLRTSWTHLDSTEGASFTGTPLQFAGPSYLIGPGATAFNLGSGSVNFRYDAVNLEAGHLWQGGDRFQARFFGGLQYGSIKQDLTGSFSDFAGTNTQTNTTRSRFSGAGPRFGVNGQFNRGNFQFLGDLAAVTLIGERQIRRDYNTTSPLFPAGNAQSFSSPNATQIVPGLDSRLGASYSFRLGSGILKLEAGYQAVIYISAINSYSQTQVATPPAPQSVGVFFATTDHLQSDFTAHGPYMSTSWSF